MGSNQEIAQAVTDERAAFEAFRDIEAQNGHGICSESAWKAWQARAALSSAQVAADRRAEPKEEKPEYCYSFNEENFEGDGACSVTDAIIEALDYDPDTESVFIGVKRDLPIKLSSIASEAVENIQNRLYDEVGEYAENFSPTDEQKAALALLMEQWIVSIGGFGCYGIKDVKQYSKGDAEFDAAIDALAQKGGA